MAYSLNSLNDDCYENTAVLKNKFDIRDELQLNTLEQSITNILQFTPNLGRICLIFRGDTTNIL